MDDNTLWFLLAYAVGTGFGYVMGKIASVRDAAGLTIDTLIEGGYLKHRIDENGDVQILKYNEE